MRSYFQGFTVFPILPLFFGLFMVWGDPPEKAISASNMQTLCPQADIISGFVSLDTFYTGDESGKRIQDVKLLLIGDEQGVGTDIVLDSTYTDENGSYSFEGLTEGAAYYIYFDNLPEGYDITYSPDASNGKTRMRRVIVPSCGVHLGLGSPKGNVPNNARVFLPVHQEGGSQGNSGISSNTGFLTIPFNPTDRGLLTDNSYQASYEQTGSLWGADFHCSTGRAYASAVLKRHSGLGPHVAPPVDGGVEDVPVDGVYMIEYWPQEQFIGAFTLQGVNGIDLGTVKRELVSRAIIPSDEQTVSPEPYALPIHDDAISLMENYDIDAFDKVGKVGFGSLAFGPSDQHAWLVNLNQKNIVRVNIGSGEDLPTDGSKVDASLVDVFPLDFSVLPECNGEYRPWALEFYEGKGYIGVVCDAADSQDANDLHAYVLSFDPNSMNVLENEFELVLDFPLNYRREIIFDTDQQWHAWISEWPHVVSDSPVEEYYAQPILSDLEFDGEGRMVISLVDRFGFQASSDNFAADLSDQTPTFTGIAAGDVLLACPAGNGLFEIEGAGNCTHGNDSGTRDHGRLALSDDGPFGAGEFFPFDHLIEYSGSSADHYEVTAGASAIHPYQEKVLHTVYDPITANYSQGVHQYNMNDGGLERAYQITRENFSKTNGLGDIVLISDPVSIEIGNYVWLDENENGIQETWEEPLAGINVSLVDMQGQVLATVQTNQDGEYYFKDSTPGFDGLDPFTMYHIVLGIDQYDPDESLILGAYKLTEADAGSSFLQDERDSDLREQTGIPTNYEGYPSLKITTGPRGQVDHSYDIGLYEFNEPCPELVSLDLRMTESVFCLNELIEFDLHHSELFFNAEVVYADRNDLTADDLYFGDWNSLGVRYLIEEMMVTNSPSSFGVDDLPSGDWTVYVKLNEDSPYIDNPDCLPFVFTEVSVGDLPSVTLQDQSACAGADIVIEPEVAEGTAPFQYVWQDGSSSEEYVLQDLQSNTIVSVTVTDAFGCDDEASANIMVNENLSVSLNQPSICQGTSVELTPTINGGEAPFTYSWSTGSINPSITVNPVTSESYTVTVTDNNGCIGEASSIVEIRENLEVNADHGEYCEGEMGRIDLEVHGSNGPFSYLWTPAWIAEDGSFEANNSFDFTVEVIDQITGCEGEAAGRVVVHPIVSIDQPNDVRSCKYYVLPEITGINLTTEASYYTQMGGRGQGYLEGDTVFSTRRLYIYDGNASIESCNDEKSFLVEIFEEIEDVELTQGNICLEDSPFTQEEENTMDLQALIMEGPNNGVWHSEPSGLIDGSHTLSIPIGFSKDTIIVRYTLEGEPGFNNECGDKQFETIVITEDCGAKLGDFVWEDSNGDGIQDDGENGIPNQKVILSGVSNTGESIMAMDTTDQNGMYMFCLLPPGAYKLTFPSIDNYIPTLPNSGGNDSNDSDADPENGNMTQIFDLEEGDTNLTIDAGYIRLSKLGDLVWEDLNANGIQDPGEPGIEDVKVILTGTDIFGNPVEREVYTDETGMYMFGDLVSGDYKITFDSPEDFVTTTLNESSGNNSEELDSDADPDNGNMTRIYNLPPGDTIPTIDAGFYQYAAVGDYVWLDDNMDGVQDDFETCFDSVLVFLYHCDRPNEALDSMRTENCRYLFDSLVPGDYFVQFVNPDNKKYGVTNSNSGNDQEDSDVNPEDMRTPCTNLESGEVDLTLDMGLVTCPTLDSVACISEVQISIGNDGAVKITPAMVLTINQDCDGLEVMVIDTLGNEYGDVVTCDMIGKDFRVMVTDINGNACWAQLNIEDKIAPRLVCPPPLTVNCDESADPGQEQVRRFEVEPSTALGPNAGQVVEIPVQVPDLGNVFVSGVNIYLDIDMENTLDYLAPGAITLTSPEGTVYDVYPFNVNPNCQLLFGITGVNHGLDDSSPQNFANCQDFESQNDFTPFGANLDQSFFGEQEEGNWVWTITDQFDTQSGIVNRLVIELELQNTIDLPQVTENCNYDLTFEDISDNRNACGVGTVIREWTATDQSGNVGTCSQTIVFEAIDRPSIIYPSDYEAECIVAPEALTPDITGEVRIVGDQSCVQLGIASDDLFLDDCAPYGFKIRRTWTVIDWCDPSFEDTHDQFIKVVDDEAPMIDCPEDFTISLRHNDCETNVSLPAASAIDNCDPDVTVTRELLDANGAVISTSSVPVGNYEGRYIAEDACGNTDTCSIHLSIVDPVAPVAVCFRELVVSLTSNGWAYLCADQIDDGSYDNCTDVGLQIKRENDPNWEFFESEVDEDNCVRFQCNDLGDQKVNLRVWDDADGDGFFGPQNDTNGDGRIDENDDTGDNFSECWTNIRVEDKLPPELICPPDITISCLQDYQDLELVGDAEVDGNCDRLDATYTDQLPNQLCPGTTIIRTWTVEKRQAGSDGVLNTPDDLVVERSCNQRITLEDDTPLRIAKLPGDVTIDCADADGLDPQDLEKFNFFDDYLNTPQDPEDDSLVVFDQPQLDYDCEQLAVNYSDRRFDLCENAYKIKRTWTIVDWCDPDFELIHVQNLIKDDSEAPQIVVNVNSLGANENNNCQGYVDFDISAIDNCGSAVIIHDSRFGNASNDPSGYYPVGNYTVTVHAVDGCGNVSTQEVSFSVQDVRSPVSLCKYGIAINIKPNGFVTLNADILDIGGRDNCTSQENLQFEIQLLNNGQPIGPRGTRLELDCSHIGSQEVRLFVIDAAGNESYCNTRVLVEDNAEVCNEVTTVSGSLITPGGQPINDVEILLNGRSQGVFDGQFSLDSIPIYSNLTVEAHRDIDHREGVTTLDLIEIRKHILKTDSLDSPYKYLAADVDMSKSISVLDILALRQLILRKTDRLGQVESWHFISGKHTFEDSNNPWTSPIPYFISASASNVPVNASFVGYKMGDVNQSISMESRSSGSWEMAYSWSKIGDAWVLHVETGAASLEGYQFCLELPSADLNLVEVEGELTSSNIGIWNKNGAYVLISWTPESDQQDNGYFKLWFENGSSDKRFGSPQVCDQLITPEAYLFDGSIKSLSFVELENSSFDYALFPNYPDPFNMRTVVPFEVPKAEMATLRIYSSQGALISEREQWVERGTNQWVIDHSELQGAGFYYYQIEFNDFVGIRKMLFVK